MICRQIDSYGYRRMKAPYFFRLQVSDLWYFIINVIVYFYHCLFQIFAMKVLVLGKDIELTEILLIYYIEGRSPEMKYIRRIEVNSISTLFHGSFEIEMVYPFDVLHRHFIWPSSIYVLLVTYMHAIII